MMQNHSSYDLLLVGAESTLAHGMYTLEWEPPRRIPANTTMTWGSESDGVMTGVEGRLTFAVGSTEAKLELAWDNPFIGANHYTQTLTGKLPDGDTYHAHDPMLPEGNPYDATEPPNLHDDHAEVLYVFGFERKSAAETDSSATARDHAPSNHDPKPIQLAPAERVLARDAHVGVRKIVFLGLNQGMPGAEGEIAQMERSHPFPAVEQKPRENHARMPYLRAVTPSGAAEFVRRRGALDRPAEEFVKTLVTLEKNQVDAYVAFERASDPVTATRSAHGSGVPPQWRIPFDRVHPARRYPIRALAEVFAEVEEDLRATKLEDPNDEPIAVAPMKRLVISGHHHPGYTHQRLDAIWGDDGHVEFTRIITLFGDLLGLAKVFPAAAAQIEDLHISACHTGYYAGGVCGEWEILPRMTEVFPNIQTVWAYEGPAVDTLLALPAWENASREPNGADEIRRASNYLRYEAVAKGWVKEPTGKTVWTTKKGGARTIVWTRGSAGLAPKANGPSPEAAVPCA